MSLIAREAAHGQATHAPLASLMLVMPILCIYEGGVLVLGPAAMRNGADAWLRHALERIGFGQYFLLPLLTLGLLLAAHHVGRHPWHVHRTTLQRMFTEAVGFALALFCVAWAWGRVAVACDLEMTLRVAPPSESARLISYLGAGIYEELVFRLMLIPTLAIGLQKFGERPLVSWMTAAVVASLLFSAAHYHCFVGCGDALVPATFLFRFIAGIIFSTLFLLRGFGVAVCAHLFYDVMHYASAS